MQLAFQAHTHKDVGKFLKTTKQLLRWTFTADAKTHEVVLYDSVMSGKLKVVLDTEVLLEKKVSDEIRKSGIRAESGPFNIYLLKIGSKWELRINDHKFVENKRSERPSLPQRSRTSEDGTEDLEHMLRDLSPGPDPKARSPDLSPIDKSNKAKFFGSAIVSNHKTDENDHSGDEDNPFAVDQQKVSERLQGFKQSKSDLKYQAKADFKKQTSEYVAIDTWGQEGLEDDGLNAWDPKGPSQSTLGTKGVSSNEVSRTFSKTNPFLETNEEEDSEAISGRQSGNMWQNFDTKTSQTAEFPVIIDNGSFAPAEQSQDPFEEDFLSKKASENGKSMQLKAAQTASFAPRQHQYQGFPPPGINRVGTFPTQMKLNFVKKGTLDPEISKEIQHQDSIGSPMKTGFLPPPPGKSAKFSSNTFVPKPDSMRQSLPAQNFDYFSDFRPKMVPQQLPNQNQHMWKKPQSAVQQPIRLDTFGQTEGRPGIPTNFNNGRPSLQSSEMRYSQPASQRLPGQGIPSGPDRKTILQHAKMVDDDQFLNF
jgi:hypothetical protein